MLPNRVGNDFLNKWQTYAKLLGDQLAPSSSFRYSSDFKHFCFGKFDAWVGLARWAVALAVALLGNHVINVILPCAKKEMTRPDTGAIVAMMQNPKPICDFAIVESVRVAVSTSVPGSIPESTIANVSMATDPYPAGGIQNSMHGTFFIDLGPETLFGYREYLRIMADDVSHRLAPNPAILLACSFGNGCWLTAPASAVAIGDFARRFVGDMIRHVVSPFSTFGHATERFVVAAVALLLVKYTYSIPQHCRIHHCKSMSEVVCT